MTTHSITSTTTYITKQLSSLFASFMVGNDNLLAGIQKYLQLHRGEASSLRKDYDEKKLDSNPLLSRIPVRINSTAFDSTSDSYYATFVATLEGPLEALPKDAAELSLSLVAGDKVLAFTPFPVDTYRSLSNKECRVDVSWKLQLTSTQD